MLLIYIFIVIITGIMAISNPDSSRILSLLLDEVVGAQDVIKMRQDYSRIFECLLCNPTSSTVLPNINNLYFTGSNAEGLDLPGSDEDYMFEINNSNVFFPITVIQSEENGVHSIYPQHVFLMETENVPPGFVLLRSKQPACLGLFSLVCSERNGLPYLSSNVLLDFGVFGRQMVQNATGHFLYFKELKTRRQGPSLETWSEFMDQSDSGMDTVPSIRCRFWPSGAREWISRPRDFSWPRTCDLSSIVEFGFHLVPVGHPKSHLKELEWRVSFSIAERTLVWSFNHIQMQLYAVLKIILKEFIKVKCSPQNYILCSYFIKTFLFWIFEETDSSFWCAENFRDCFMFLIREFSQCIREGRLRHYFFPRFNLLSVKLTREAQIELLQILDCIVQCDVSIFKECATLCDAWSDFVAYHKNKYVVENNIKRQYILDQDKCMVKMLIRVSAVTMAISNQSIENETHLSRVLDLPCDTHLLPVVIKCFLFHKYFTYQFLRCSENKVIYRLHRNVKNAAISLDISTIKLRYAMVLLIKRDYISTLTLVNRVLSSIPPYAMYISDCRVWSNDDAKGFYVDMFINSDTSQIQRMKKAWLVDLEFVKQTADGLPLAIQIELYFSDDPVGVWISPYICAYYLIFLCFHELGEYDKRDRALQHLIEVVNNEVQRGTLFHHSYNITGHCLLVVGDIDRARDMFTLSYELSRMIQPYDKYNSAPWYLQNFT